MGKLYIIATPIGNLEDITLRAIRVLGAVDALACEDTRRTRILFEKHGIPSPRSIFSYREANEARAASRIIGILAEGKTVGVCSDAGYPGVSDAGFRVIQQALEEGHEVEVVPGAGAIEPALLSSGLPTSSFTFKGFPPRKPGPRRRFLAMDKDLPHTLVFYESPFRLHSLLVDAREVLGDRKASVSIELTKQFERTIRGSLAELCGRFEDWKARGEVTVVIAGNNPKFMGDADGKALGEDV
ncbi:MAG TPA: 16S rRNA (cytidine(1402)-2'-O)-methyltransferase [Spirochaetia bacterium]|nr:16S rRNA (cytidine(1402)-2'-O)-methyltransferase [Spirochaetia bacterium]